MIPLKLQSRFVKKAYKPHNAVLRISELPSKRDVRLLHVKCLDVDKDHIVAWEVRLEIRTEYNYESRIFVYSMKSPPLGEFGKLQEVIAEKLGLRLTREPYYLQKLFDGSLSVQRQDTETGKLKNIIFTAVRQGYSRSRSCVEVEFTQVNNTRLFPGEYEKIIDFLEKKTGLKQAQRYPQKQFNF